ncbi:hemolysin-III channel protein-like protein Izh2 [Hypomontagnella monticulosa]|nr:hemolysin-III channel protein-like protein Izh2 [Hypomontagnella monticulosa]
MAVQRATGSQTVITKNLTTQTLRGRLLNDNPVQADRQPVLEQQNVKLIRLLEYENVSAWTQSGSEHIRTGYRPEVPSLWSCLHSWSYIHNETVNIFTHLVGALVFFVLPLYIFKTEIPPRYKIATTADILVCSTYFLGVAICFTFSTIYHTFMCHSAAVRSLGVKFDYQGILLLMWGANIPLIYYSVPCDLRAQITYWAFDTVLAGMCSYMTFHPAIEGPHLAHMRAGLFAFFGFCAVVLPNLLAILVYGFEEQSRRVGLGWIAACTLFNGTGALIYAIRFPEKWFPRTFDFFGASHQIMHVMALSAAVSFTMAMLQAFDFHHQYGRACTGGAII